MEEELMQALEIPYRVVQLCTGDLSQPSASTYDIESWLPGQNEGRGQYRETHSTSNTTDFQARRLNIRYRSAVKGPSDVKILAGRRASEINYVHMLNGTAAAIGRTLIAVLENYQQEDGSIEIPKVLQPYTGFVKIKR
jgi:seryl-tRNA synthetase